MEIKKSLNNQENSFFSVKRKRNIRSDILNLLSKPKNQFGLNVSQIAEQLQLSRNTVKSYLGRFEKEGLIQVKEMGRAKICILREPQTISPKKQWNPLFSLTQDFFDNFFRIFDTLAASQIQDHKRFIKQIGAGMAPLTIWPTGRLLPPASTKKESISVYELKKYSLQYLELINAFGEILHFELDPAFPTRTNPIIRLKITALRNKGFNKLYGWIWAGLLEAKLRETYDDSIYIEILDYQEYPSSWYFELGIREEKEITL